MGNSKTKNEAGGHRKQHGWYRRLSEQNRKNSFGSFFDSSENTSLINWFRTTREIMGIRTAKN